MKVSVIILTYNRAHMVTKAIDSVLKQTFEDFELIVVDNYSSDNTESVVKSYNDKRLRYFKNQNNGFIGVNRNYGIEKSRGEYIAFLDDDDLWLPEKLEKQVELLESNKELGLVYSDSYIIDGNGDSGENTFFYSIKPVRGNAFNKLFQFNFIPMLTVIIRKEVIDKTGMFSTRYKIALDYDLWLRIAEYYPVDFIAHPLAIRRLHAESSTQKEGFLVYQEVLQIVGYWLTRKPELKRELGGEIRRRKALMYYAMVLAAVTSVYRNKNTKSIREFGGLVKYLVLPKH